MKKANGTICRRIVVTVIYAVLMVLMALIRFPLTVDSVRVNGTFDVEAAQTGQTDLRGRPVLDGYALYYDQGKGFSYGEKVIIENKIQGAVEADGAVRFTVYQDGDPTLLTRLNSLGRLKALRFELPQSGTVQSVEFLNGEKVQKTISAAELSAQYGAVTDGGAVLLDTSFGSAYYRAFHYFGIPNIAMMLIFTIAYLFIEYGHRMVDRLQQKLLNG